MRRVAVVVLLVLLVVVGLPVAAGHQMTWCPECPSGSALPAIALCLAVLVAGIVLVPVRVEWLPGRSHPRTRLLVPAMVDPPPRPA
ncbi:MAG: hypothetical protein ACRDKW_16450 [Actinomycetota bacterium]